MQQIFGIKAEQVQVDTTSFCVSGEYATGEEAGETAVIAITYGYSRDYRTDLKQWMLATSDDTRWRRAAVHAAAFLATAVTR